MRYRLKLMLCGVAIFSAMSIAVWADCDQRCLTISDIITHTNAFSLDVVEIITRCYSVCAVDQLQMNGMNVNESELLSCTNDCFRSCIGAPNCSQLQGDHGVPPSTPIDDITYIPYSARAYTLGINFTSVPLEIAYVVRLITNATNTTSYFFVLPGLTQFRSMSPATNHYCNLSTWSYATANAAGISNFSSSAEDCLSVPEAVITDDDICFGLDLRPGYENHYYAYVTWSYTIDTVTEVEVTYDATDIESNRPLDITETNKSGSFIIQSLSPDDQMITNLAGSSSDILVQIHMTNVIREFRNGDGTVFESLSCDRDRKLPILSISILDNIVHPDCTYHFAFDASLEYDPIVLEELDVLTVYVIPTGSNDRTKYQSYLSPYHVPRLIQPNYPEIINYTCQCEHDYVHYTCEHACTSMGFTDDNYTDCLSSCNAATTFSEVFNSHNLEPGTYDILVVVAKDDFTALHYGNEPHNVNITSYTFKKCPATQPQNVVYELIGACINISWSPPANTYHHNIVYYVVFVGREGDNVTQVPVEHLTDPRYTVINGSDTLSTVIDLEMAPTGNLSIRVRADTTLTEGQWSDEVTLPACSGNNSRPSVSLNLQSESQPGCKYGLILEWSVEYNIDFLEALDFFRITVASEINDFPIVQEKTIPAHDTNTLIKPAYPALNDFLYQCGVPFKHYNCVEACAAMNLTSNTTCLSSCQNVTWYKTELDIIFVPNIKEDYTIQFFTHMHEKTNICTPSNILEVVKFPAKCCLLTEITGRIKHNKRKKKTQLIFSSDDDLKATYQCKLNNKMFKECKSPISWKNLRKGKHTVTVRAHCLNNESTVTLERKFQFQVR